MLMPIFLEENKKTITNFSSAKLAQKVVKVKWILRRRDPSNADKDIKKKTKNAYISLTPLNPTFI